MSNTYREGVLSAQTLQLVPAMADVRVLSSVRSENGMAVKELYFSKWKKYVFLDSHLVSLVRNQELEENSVNCERLELFCSNNAKISSELHRFLSS